MEGLGEDAVAVVGMGHVWVVGSVLWEEVGAEDVGDGKFALWLWGS